jgi:hypothetical protein
MLQKGREEDITLPVYNKLNKICLPIEMYLGNDLFAND